MTVGPAGRRGAKTRGDRPRPVDDRAPPAFLSV